MDGFVGTLSKMFSNKQDLAERLQQGGNSTSQNVNSTLAVMVGASVELAQGENFSSNKTNTPQLKTSFPTLQRSPT